MIREGVRTRQVFSADPTGGNDDGYTGRWSCLHPLPLGMPPGPAPGSWRARVGLVGGSRVWRRKPRRPSPDRARRADGRRRAVSGHRRRTPRGRLRVAAGAERRRELRRLLARRADAVPPRDACLRRRPIRATTTSSTARSTARSASGRSRGRASRLTSSPSSIGPGRATQAAHGDTPSAFAGPSRCARGATSPSRGCAGAGRSRHCACAYAGWLQRARGSRHTAHDGCAARSAAARLLRWPGDGRRPAGRVLRFGPRTARVRALLFAMDARAGGWATSWWADALWRPGGPTAAQLLPHRRGGGDLRLTAARSPRWRAALGPRGNAGLFHARGIRPTRPDAPWTLLRARGTGTFTGVTVTMEGPAPPRYLEGDEQGFVDDAGRPALQGTGTEDFFGGAWYFYERLFSLPLTGYPGKGVSGPTCHAASCTTAYRVMVADAVLSRGPCATC